MTNTADAISSFADLQLPLYLQKALSDVGYETPSAIQAKTIPPLLEGQDVLGQAQTGTGKTAAFALPVLARIDVSDKTPQVLVLAPTRELALQVSEAFQRYASYLDGFRVLPLYGGADYRTQLKQLKRGVQVIVGTPGRVMDHMRRGTLDVSQLKTLVLDEADEMLRMGFIDDVEWVLEQLPENRQMALFSATMPAPIKRITQRHLNNPAEISIGVETVTNSAIRQRVWQMGGVNKLDALTRILEIEDTDAIIIFVRTRIATVELAEKLAARGYETAALNGDIPQQQRERTVAQLKSGALDILVATDVAARGLDVERISHVVNYDIPYDAEAYVHRIGRTGRAGRSGEAILFVSRREQRLLRSIEKATGQPIEKMNLPSVEAVADKRIERFKQTITDTLATESLGKMRQMVDEYQAEYGVAVLDIAAALACLAQGKKTSSVITIQEGDSKRPRRERDERPRREKKDGKRRETGDAKKERKETRKSDRPTDKKSRPELSDALPRPDMELYRMAVGRKDDVTPGAIVGAIANEAELDSQYIGQISIYEDHSTVELPEGMPKELLRHLKKVWVAGQRLQMTRADKDSQPRRGKPKHSGPRKRKAKKTTF